MSKQYSLNKTILISSDEIKKTLPNYLPKNAELLHSRSAKLADKEFHKCVKESSYRQIILFNGGSASGKTEFILTQLNNKEMIIYDGTMSSIEGLKIKINSILRAKKIPEIYAVIPDNLERAFLAFLNRDRKFSDDHFYYTHSRSRNTLLYAANKYPNIKIKLIESTYDNKNKLEFRRIDYGKRQSLIKYLESIQLTENDIIKLVNNQ